MTAEELCFLCDAITQRLRAEMWALHLGDDAVVDEDTAARMLGVSARTLRRLADLGEIERGALGRSPRYGVGAIRRLSRRLACEEVRTV